MKNIKDHSTNDDNHSESDLLSGMKRVNAFKTPEGYFQKLPVEISKKLHAFASHESETEFAFPKFAVAAAIVISLLATGGLYFLNNSKENQSENVTLTYDDLIESGYADEYEDLILIDHYFSYKSTETVDSTQSSLNEYLLNGDIDITLIINEL